MFKVNSVYQTFYFQRTCICPSVWYRHAEYFETHFMYEIKCATSMLTYKYCADISMQNTLKAWSMTQIWPRGILLNNSLWKCFAWKIYAQFRCEHVTFKVFCMPMLKLGQMLVLSKWNTW